MNQSTKVPGDPSTIIPLEEGTNAAIVAAFNNAHTKRGVPYGWITGRKDGIRRRAEHLPSYVYRGGVCQYAPRTIRHTVKGVFYVMRVEVVPGRWEERTVSAKRLPKHLA